MTSNSDYSADFLDDELEDEVDKMSRIPSVTYAFFWFFLKILAHIFSRMNRLIRRDVAGGNTKLLADVDVAAPSVNVQDLPESGRNFSIFFSNSSQFFLSRSWKSYWKS